MPARPQRFDQLFARDDLARVIEELDQDAQRLLWQAGAAPVARDLSRDAIHRPAVELQGVPAATRPNNKEVRRIQGPLMA